MDVVMYASDHETYLFMQSDRSTRYAYTLATNADEYEHLRRIYSSSPGRAIGVAAVVCGRVAPVDLPLADAELGVIIQRITILREIDLTSDVATLTGVGEIDAAIRR